MISFCRLAILAILAREQPVAFCTADQEALFSSTVTIAVLCFTFSGRPL